jgi:hypothetical protein
LSARRKLNAAAVHGAILISALVGWLFRSWVVFLLALAVLIGTSIHSGEIRRGPRRR